MDSTVVYNAMLTALRITVDFKDYQVQSKMLQILLCTVPTVYFLTPPF